MRRPSDRNNSDQQFLAASSPVFTENTKTTVQRNPTVTRNRGSRGREEAKDRAEEDQAINNDDEAEGGGDARFGANDSESSLGES